LERYAAIDTRGARVVELRIYGGLKMREIAGLLGITRRTAQNDWRIALMWLRRELDRGPNH
jgi:DNA-directed RNA polymerase specialized sigma24 family protein